MQIDHCSFPEDILYDPDNFVWAKVESDKLVRVGINSIFSSLAGRLIRVSLKGININITKGRSLGTIESGRYFGVVRSPVTGSIVEINDAVVSNPKLVNDSPYADGWVSVIKNENLSLEIKHLDTIQRCHDIVRSQIKRLHTRCFVAFPDHEMFEIGHIVSDDVTADLEMMRWSELRSQPILEIRQENSLFHILVKKSS